MSIENMVKAARSAHSVDRISNGEIIDRIAGPQYGERLVRGIIESALTAEAGKGEVTDAMVEAGCLAVVTVSGFKPENWPHTYPDAGQLRKAVRAALEAALSTATPAGEWREIESAPKDGTAVDVWNGERVPGARWCRPDGGSIDYKDWCVSVPEVDGCSVSWCMENIHPHPTHWRPLPAPPLAASPRGAVEAK